MNAVNLNESLNYYTKVFTIFTACWVIFKILGTQHRKIITLVNLLCILLLVDSGFTFFKIIQFITGHLEAISDIVFVYSNKNVLAAAIFIKIPAALWLASYFKGWQKHLGYIALFAGLLATIILSTRSFYLGLVGTTFAFALFVLIRVWSFKERFLLKKLGIFIGLIGLAILLHSGIQGYIFPKEKDHTHNQNVAARLEGAIIYQSQVERFDSWKRSAKLIGEHPLLGVGSGNWKIDVLKYESKELPNFKYMYKNHNDFIEITAETGIPGGLAYLSIFIFILLAFARATFNKQKKTDEDVKFLFLPAFGILAYMVDAFFNFPANRPEIQVLFAIYVAIGATLMKNNPAKNFENKRLASLVKLFENHYFNTALKYIYLLLLAGCSFLLFLNFKSLKIQRLVKEESIRNTYSPSTLDAVLTYPSIPNINCTGGPLVGDKANYLGAFNREQEAIDLLVMDHSTPFDGRREYLLATLYEKIGNQDSAIKWAKTAFELKPKFFDAVNLYSTLLSQIGNQRQAINITNTFTEQYPFEPNGWLLLAELYLKNGQNEQALQKLQQGVGYFPNHTRLNNVYYDFLKQVRMPNLQALYNSAIAHLFEGKLQEALTLLDDLINKEPQITDFFWAKAICYYNMKRYEDCIETINQSLKMWPVKFDLYNQRGDCYRLMGNMDQACEDYKTAMEYGIELGRSNYESFCIEQK